MKNRLKLAQDELGRIPWALSGSLAMKLYANKYGVSTREPQNVNIVVNQKNLANAYSVLFNLVKPRNIPRNTSRTKSKNHYNLKPYDLLKSGTNLAPSIREYVKLNGVPVIKLENLLNQKQKTLRNVPSNKAKGDIKIIMEILNKRGNAKNNIITRNKANTSSPSPPSRFHHNNFSTPPGSPVDRKLVF